MEKSARVYIAGHTGMVGSAIKRQLEKEKYSRIITKTSQELDLANQQATEAFFVEEKPEYVFLCAARVGGIHANATFPAEFITQNLKIQANVITAAWKANVKKLIFFGSSCMYPKECPQPMKEESLLTGKLEPTNEACAIAKIAGWQMCKAYNKQYKTNFVTVIPTNLYGPNDQFDALNAHLIPALITKFHHAKKNGDKEVTVWGTGKPLRDFLYVDDATEAVIIIMKKDTTKETNEIINIGSGKDFTVKEIVEITKECVGFSGKMVWDTTKPDGVYRKLLDASRITELGWKPRIELREGIQKTYEWFVKNR